MNRPGQPQQRPPSLGTNPGLANQYRPPFPTYGLPQRVMQSGGFVPGLQPNSHRTPGQQSQVQTITPQPTPGFMQTRSQSGFPFGSTLGQHQPTNSLQQQLSSQQQQTNGSSNLLPPHLVPTPGLGTGTSVSSTSEVSLDPNDFPALGSTPANNTNSGSGTSGNAAGAGTSYASQAGTGVPIGGTGATGSGAGAIGSAAGSGSQARDFTPDDFPALGGQAPNSSQNQNSNQESHPHPPGLNGFQHSDHPLQQQHRQNLLGALGGGMQGTPGMLNLAPTQARNVHPGFQQGQNETEKQQQQRNNYPPKLNQPAWGSPNLTSSQSQQPAGGNGPNGTQSNSILLTSSHLSAPSGVPQPTGSYSQQPQSTHTIAGLTNAPSSATVQPYPANGLTSGDSLANPSNSNPNPAPTQPNLASLQPPSASLLHHPQTPAQQVLMSAADRWGLLSLIAMVKNANSDIDHGLSSIGTDLGTMGLDMGYAGNLYSTFITPWADQSAAHTVEPDFHLPACYLNVQAPPPGPAKAAVFSDETLFFMFYSSPRDALQEVAAQELWNRNWRYHKDLRLWITKESGTSPSQKVQGGNGEQGLYTFWDPENWGKERKEMTVMYADLEEKSTPAFAHGPGLVIAQGTSAGQLGTPVHQSQVPSTQRAAFQMGIAGM